MSFFLSRRREGTWSRYIRLTQVKPVLAMYCLAFPGLLLEDIRSICSYADWRSTIPYKEATYSSTVTTFDAKSGHETSVAASFCSWVNEAVASDLKEKELAR